MVTQMYFPGDPLFALDPIYQSIVDPQARERLVAAYDHDVSEHEWCTGYRWDIVLTGSHRTPVEEDRAVSSRATPGQTVGPFFAFGLQYAGDAALVPPGPPGRRPAARPGPRRCRRARARRSRRGLAGRARRRCRPTSRLAAAGRRHLHRLGPLRHRLRRPLRVHHRRRLRRAPFFALTVFARGLLDRLFTRAYLPDAALDPFLHGVGDRRAARCSRRGTRAASSSTSTCRVTTRPSSSSIPETEPMTDLLWPGDHRAGDHFTGGQVLAAILAVEESWLGVLVDAGVAPAAARSTLPLRQEHVERMRGPVRVCRQPGAGARGALARRPRPRAGGP